MNQFNNSIQLNFMIAWRFIAVQRLILQSCPHLGISSLSISFRNPVIVLESEMHAFPAAAKPENIDKTVKSAEHNAVYVATPWYNYDTIVTLCKHEGWFRAALLQLWSASPKGSHWHEWERTFQLLMANIDLQILFLLTSSKGTKVSRNTNIAKGSSWQI